MQELQKASASGLAHPRDGSRRFDAAVRGIENDRSASPFDAQFNGLENIIIKATIVKSGKRDESIDSDTFIMEMESSE